MEIGDGLIQWGVSGILSGGIAFGIIKGRISNLMTFNTHREICEKERAKTDTALSEIRESQKDIHGMIKEIHGYLKATHGGSL
jgi:hypothetical protein